MATSEKLCLQRNDFKETITSSFSELRKDRGFADVTLVCEDGRQIKAHKFVLASSSPFFNALLKGNIHPHPLIYMRGLRSEDILAMLDFLYLGESKVFQENLDSFLALAEELKLKGFTTNAESEKDLETPEPQSVSTKKELYQQIPESKLNSNIKSPVSKKFVDASISLTQEKISVDLEDLDEKIKDMFTKTDIPAGGDRGYLATCNVCGKQLPLKAMPSHIEANHITGISHTCDICGKGFRSRRSLGPHVSRKHDIRQQKLLHQAQKESDFRLRTK